jgi:SAM-dependent methyltransferase
MGAAKAMSEMVVVNELSRYRWPMTQSPYTGEVLMGGKIVNAHADMHAREAERHLRFAIERLGLRIPPGARILDFGCGIGSSVGTLLTLGYDAYGVDVMEYWERDFDKFWHVAEKPPPEIAARLKLVDLSNYRLPFEDGTFDFCFSDQVFEHVFDYKTTMAEIVRVLKPGAASVHNFPGPNNLMEGHVNLPFPWLCYSRAYLRLGAWIAWMRGIEPDWRRLARAWVNVMRFNNYPTKWRLRRVARSASVAICFAEVEEFLFREGSPLKTRVLKWLRRIRLDRVAVRTAGLVMLQRYMVLKALPSNSR